MTSVVFEYRTAGQDKFCSVLIWKRVLLFMLDMPWNIRLRSLVCCNIHDIYWCSSRDITLSHDTGRVDLKPIGPPNWASCLRGPALELSVLCVQVHTTTQCRFYREQQWLISKKIWGSAPSEAGTAWYCHQVQEHIWCLQCVNPRKFTNKLAWFNKLSIGLRRCFFLLFLRTTLLNIWCYVHL